MELIVFFYISELRFCFRVLWQKFAFMIMACGAASGAHHNFIPRRIYLAETSANVGKNGFDHHEADLVSFFN